MTGANELDEASGIDVGGHTAPAKVPVELRIRQLENPAETLEIGSVEVGARAAQERLQDRVELPHAATATPAQLRKLAAHATIPRQ